MKCEVARFLGEAEAASKPSHPNVVQVFDAGQANRATASRADGREPGDAISMES